MANCVTTSPGFLGERQLGKQPQLQLGDGSQRPPVPWGNDNGRRCAPDREPRVATSPGFLGERQPTSSARHARHRPVTASLDFQRERQLRDRSPKGCNVSRFLGGTTTRRATGANGAGGVSTSPGLLGERQVGRCHFCSRLRPPVSWGNGNTSISLEASLSQRLPRSRGNDNAEIGILTTTLHQSQCPPVSRGNGKIWWSDLKALVPKSQRPPPSRGNDKLT